MSMKFQYTDGGRKEAGYKVNHVGDCVARALVIANDLDYRTTYRELQKAQQTFYFTKGYSYARNINDGCTYEVFEPWLEKKGWKVYWRETDREKKRYRLDNLPKRKKLIVLSRKGRKRHLSAVINGELRDTWNSADGEWFIMRIWVRK